MLDPNCFLLHSLTAMEQARFKFDALISKTSPDHFLFLVNFNLPAVHLTDGSLEQRLGVIQRCLDSEFRQEIASGKLQYCVTATYTLQHAETGETKLWTGTFQPIARRKTYLRPFAVYSPNDFVPQSVAAVELRHTTNSLTWIGEDTKWTFDSLESVIFCFQVKCSTTLHPFRPSLLMPAQHVPRLQQAVGTCRYWGYI